MTDCRLFACGRGCLTSGDDGRGSWEVAGLSKGNLVPGRGIADLLDAVAKGSSIAVQIRVECRQRLL